MTEQQRRQQIMQARQQADQTRSAVPRMSDQEAERIASQGQGLTQEQVIAIAMMGKFVQNDITGVKKSSLGDLKVSDGVTNLLKMAFQLKVLHHRNNHLEYKMQFRHIHFLI